MFDFADDTNDLLFHLRDALLLLLHTELGLVDAPVQLVELLCREITCLAILKDLFFLSFIGKVGIKATKTELLLLKFLLLDHVTNQYLHALGLALFLDLRPHLHNGVLESDFVLVVLQLFLVLLRVLHAVVEDVVQGYLRLVIGVHEFIEDFFLSILEVSSSLHDIFKALIAEFEAGHWSATSVFRISDVFHYKCLVIDYCTCSEPLNDKLSLLFLFFLFILFFWGSLVVRN